MADVKAEVPNKTGTGERSDANIDASIPSDATKGDSNQSLASCEPEKLDSIASDTVTEKASSTETEEATSIVKSSEAGKNDTSANGTSSGEDKSDGSTKGGTEDKGEKTGDEKDAKSSEEKKTKKALPRGMKANVKDLWAKTDAQCKCCTTWVEENPDDSNNVESSDETVQHAVLLRYKKRHEGTSKPLKLDSIVVHSPLIKEVLQRIFTGYPDLVVDLDELVFDAPFTPFFFRWHAFVEALTTEKDEMTKSHLELLHKALDKELTKPMQRQKDLIRSKAIDFELLWTLFSPGSLMYSHDDNEDRLYETADCEYWNDCGVQKFTVRCVMIDWDGEKFGRTTLSETLTRFKGTRKITSLPSYPLQFHQDPEAMKQKCVDRGRRFRDLAGVSCKDYKGTGIEYTKYSYQTIKSKRHVDGRIMLDEELFTKFNPDETQTIRELGEDAEDMRNTETEAMANLTKRAVEAKEALRKALEAEAKDKADTVKKESTEVSESITNGEGTASRDKKLTSASTTLTESTEHCLAKDDGLSDLATDLTGTQAPMQEISSKQADEQVSATTASSERGILTPASETDITKDGETGVEEAKVYSNSEKQELTVDQLAICNAWLRGYSFAHSKWTSFSVKNISDIMWNKKAFDQLTLPEEYRELILATVQSQMRQNKMKQAMEKAEKEQKPIQSLLGPEGGKSGLNSQDGHVQFDDFISGKGLGYVMLFSGTPGVGKTACAQALSELLESPLMVVSVGQLGTTAESVEDALKDCMELASKWCAVLLLDEADIWLETRSRSEIHRNAVVSVFLRMTEIFEGLLCLTSNRSSELDPAIISRLSLSLPFPDLSENNREQIWRTFVKHLTNSAKKQNPHFDMEANGEEPNRLPAPEAATIPPQEQTPETSKNSVVHLSAADFRKLAQADLNGRQIKNCLKTALLLAQYRGERLELKHCKMALKTIDGIGLGKREVGRMYY